MKELRCSQAYLDYPLKSPLPHPLQKKANEKNLHLQKF